MDLAVFFEGMTSEPSSTKKLGRRPLRRWLGRVFAAMLLGPVVLYGTWWWRASSGWNAELARLKAAGEWTSVDDFSNRPGLSGLNYAEPVMHALNLLKSDKDEIRAELDSEFCDLQRTYPLSERAKVLLNICVTSNADALKAFDEARGRTQVEWNRTYASPLFTANYPDQKVRLVASVAHDEAMLSFDRGDHQKAFDRWEQIYELGDRYFVNPTLIDYLIANGIQSIAVCELHETAASLKIGLGENDVPRERVVALIAELLDQSKANDRFANAFRGERVVQLDTLQSVPASMTNGNVTKTSIKGRFGAWMLRPLLRSDMTLISQRTNELVSLKSVTTSAEAKAQLKASPLTASFENKRHLLANLIAGHHERIVSHKFADRANRDLAAMALAARLYAIDHGRLPETLNELTPNYLPEIPIDPFSGQQYKFVRDVKEPRIYSLGQDEMDNGGAQPLNGQSKNTDIVVYLIQQPARVTETTDEFERIHEATIKKKNEK